MIDAALFILGIVVGGLSSAWALAMIALARATRPSVK